MGNSQFRDIALETVAFVRPNRPWKRELAQEVHIAFNRISGLRFYDFPEYKLDKALLDCLIIVNSMSLTPLVTSTHVAASKSLVIMINDVVSQVNVSTEMQYTDSDGEISQLLASFRAYTVSQVPLFRPLEKSKVENLWELASAIHSLAVNPNMRPEYLWVLTNLFRSSFDL